MSDSKAQSILNAGAVLITLTGLGVTSRISSRFIMKTMGLDDVLILLSWLMSLGICCVVMLATRYGLGTHRSEVPNDDYDKFLKLQMASSVTYSWGVSTAKASFAVLYLRIFPEGGFRLVNKCLIGFLFAQALEETCVVLFRCRPIQKAWDFGIEGSCFELHPLWYTTFVFNLITDLTLFIEPIPSTWKLQLPLVKRLAIIAMLSLGLLVTSISVIRIVYVTGIGEDDTYQLAEPLIWSMVEICALIICSCIPSLRHVVSKIPGLNSALGLSSGDNSKPSYGRSRGNNLSIPLQSRARKEYIQSQKSRGWSQHRSNGFGMTSRVTATAMDGISENGSQDEIFPHKSDQTGVITVTTEVQHQVEQNTEESSTAFTDASSQNHVDPINSKEELSDRISPTKATGDANWLRRSK
ncbi:hypothetical protein GGR54DRAFT_635089 [Hypoxylon sp. NC1633]|nr:hypothetical protein GGR54DRAFT_635089 [Hypoxylon sp. NC1633]